MWSRSSTGNSKYNSFSGEINGKKTIFGNTLSQREQMLMKLTRIRPGSNDEKKGTD